MTSRTIDKHCGLCNTYMYSVQPRDYEAIKRVVFCCQAHKIEYESKANEEIKKKQEATETKKDMYKLWFSEGDCY